MNFSKSSSIAFCSGLIAMVFGAIAFYLSWNSWDLFGGPLPGYRVFLFPGNLTLVYFWHPIFTEEVNFWPKLFMLLIGQFIVVTCSVAVLICLKQLWIRKFHNK